MGSIKQKLLWSGVAVVSVICLFFIIVLSFWLVSRDKIYPGVSVAGVSISGKSKEEAEKILKEKTDVYLSGQLNLSSEKSKLLKLSDLKINYDFTKTYEAALGFGSKNPFVLGNSRDFPLEFTYDEKALYDQIDAQNEEIIKAVINSRTEKVGEEIKVIEGTAGKQINFSETAYRSEKAVGNLENKVEVASFEILPTFNADDLEAKLSEIKEKSKNPLDLTDGSNIFKVKTEDIISWVDLGGTQKSKAEMFEGDFLFDGIFGGQGNKSIFSSELVSNYLLGISGKINSSPVNAKLSISGGKATIFVPSKDGKTLNIEASTQEIIDSLENSKTDVRLVVEIKKPEVREESLNDMGIIELLSSGYSNFAGSPANRRHNIKVGSSKFNGVLIKPGQTFSFNETLGPVDASTGYLPELVIKEKKTIPEYGGGMCQVSSTAFRAALNGGLPILERTYHAYPVVYYKPYGVDATVYLPKPDLVFKNDTGKYILIQTRISGNNLYFDFYGTKLARTVKFGGSENGSGAVFPVEQVNPLIYDQGARGNGSFTAVVWRFIYDATGKLIDNDKFVSKYDSPDKYPH